MGRIRLALLCRKHEISGLGKRILEKLKEDSRFELVTVIVAPPAEREGTAPFNGVSNFYKIIFWACANHLDRILGKPAKRKNVVSLGYDVDDQFCTDTLFPDTPVLEVSPRRVPGRPGYRLMYEDIERLISYDFDVILNFGCISLCRDAANAARFGIWSYDETGNCKNDQWPAGFHEWYAGNGECKAALEVVAKEFDENMIIASSTYRTYSLSWNENRRRVRDASSMLMLDALEYLAETGKRPAPQPHVYRIFDHRVSATPEVPISLAAICKLLWRYTANVVVKLAYQDQWRLLVHDGPPGDVPVASFHIIRPPRDRYWADPFVLKHDDRRFIFFEDYSFQERKGSISVIEFDKGQILDYREIIDAPYHLSFPFVFEFERKLYLLPESVQNKTIELWSCENFPAQWKRSHVLMEGIPAVDTVLFQHDGIWWMFTNIRRVGQQNLAELHIFYSEHPLTKNWVRHPLNPVVRDARNARMGGRVFRTRDARIIRCAQSNCGHYGNGIIFCEVTRLSRDSYEERIIGEVQPNWDLRVIGTHHFDSDSTFTAIDANFRIAKFQRR